MIYLNKKTYPYMEEVNEGILREFQRLPFTGRALDVGCGRAQLGEAVKNLGWEVWGVEQSGEACDTARTRINHLIETDLQRSEQIRSQLGDNRFDALIFSDVLEHLYDPLGVLERYLLYVKPGGKVFISVPNAVVWTNRLRLAFGSVEYTDTGVMDRTHIRFFTFRTARRLVEAAGCRIDRVASTPYLVRAALPLLKRFMAKPNADAAPDPRAMVESRGYKLYLKYVYPLERFFASLWRTMFAFRIIVVATKPAREGRS
jgi:2-polyprenyl-3-methyl-5-hydroxy-6-metoxy-1,4-benzoquinol methylase